MAQSTVDARRTDPTQLQLGPSQLDWIKSSTASKASTCPDTQGPWDAQLCPAPSGAACYTSACPSLLAASRPLLEVRSHARMGALALKQTIYCSCWTQGTRCRLGGMPAPCICTQQCGLGFRVARGAHIQGSFSVRLTQSMPAASARSAPWQLYFEGTVMQDW